MSKPFWNVSPRADLDGIRAERTVEAAIKTEPILKGRLQRALEAGGSAAVEALFEHPVIRIPHRIIEAWIQEEK